ncbi:MAG: DUF6807 family protein [Thermogutta sp.]
MLTNSPFTCRFAAALFALVWIVSSEMFASENESPEDTPKQITLKIPAKCLEVPARVAVPGDLSLSDRAQCVVETVNPEVKILAEVLPGPGPAGLLQSCGYLLLTRATSEKDTTQDAETISLQLQLTPGSDGRKETPSAFRWEETSEATLTLYEAENSPIFAYNFGPIINPKVPANDPRRTRSCYVHPVWGLRGEVLTDDFPRDHYHHHGIFWTWPHVVIRDQEFSLWEDKGALRQRFHKWLCRETSPNFATLGVENGWMLDDECLLTERVWITVYRTGSLGRFIDIDLFLLPHVPVTLWGAEGKSYGGLTMRFRPPAQKEAMITVPDGLTTDDLYETRLPWADFTSRFGETEVLSGGTIMVAPTHPDYPPTWLTRHYGPLCIGWPGIQSRTLEPGSSTRLSYRLWIHSDLPTATEIQRIYDLYATIVHVKCKSSNER